MLPLRHAVLEDDTTDDDGDGGCDVTCETKGCSRTSDIRRFDHSLEGNKWGLEIRANADTGDDLVDDDAGPGRIVFEIDVKAEAEGHEEEAEPDWWEIFACFLDHDADDGGDEG